ncbi:MAG: hypothetical protein IJG37_08360 [Synergistaceae bacterium]|nr:hypothetical protein [Synergistaceae bacterium]MBQ4431287.1 hypothetical protein [Synergistaceae bacterium]
MTLLEKLSTQIPRSECKVRFVGLYRLVEQNMAEIEEALNRGYSWSQICKAFKEVFAENWEQDCIPGYVRDYYKRIRKEKGNA